MILKTHVFEDFLAAMCAGRNPELPVVGRSYAVCGRPLHLERTLAEDPKARALMCRLELADVRFFHINMPARRLRGPVCLLPLLVNGRVVDLFVAEVFGGLIVLAIYNSDELAAYALADELAGGDGDLHGPW